MKKGTKAFTLVVFLIALCALGYYTHLTNKSSNRQSADQKTEKEILLDYDMDNDYPKTARDAVVLHCRYLKYIYNEGISKDFTEDELFSMNQKIRQLYDEDLLEINTPDQQLQALKNEIDLYEVNKQKFVSYTLAEPSQIEYNTEQGVEYAKMRVTIAMTVDGASLSVDEEYILRKDSEDRWRILGWQAVQQGTAEEEGDAE